MSKKDSEGLVPKKSREPKLSGRTGKIQLKKIVLRSTPMNRCVMHPGLGRNHVKELGKIIP